MAKLKTINPLSGNEDGHSLRQYGQKHTPELEKKFLDCISQGFSITKGAKAVGVTRRTIVNWQQKDPVFKAALADAVEEGCDKLEDEMFRRAYDGVDRPVFYQGSECGIVKEYSDTLAIILAKAWRPDKFRERTETQHNLSEAAEAMFERIAENTRPIYAKVIDAKPQEKSDD